MTDPLTIEFQIRSVNEEDRTIEGIAIPYDVTIDLPAQGIKERIARGAFGTPESVPLFLEHSWFRSGDPRSIGEVNFFEDGPSGLGVKAKLNHSARATAAYKRALSGELNSFSAAFNSIEDKNEGNVVVRTKADLLEVSLVQKPAYEGARVTQVRDDQNIKEVDNMSTNVIETTSEDVTELRAEVTTLKREIATLSQGGNKKDAGPQFRTAVEAYQAFLKGDEAAVAEIRAYTGGTAADFVAGEDWKGLLGGVVKRNRPLVEAFSRAPLSDGAETVTYEKIASVTGDVSSQVADGDVVASIQVTTAKETAAVETFAAYSELSFQAVQRVLTDSGQIHLNRQAASYAKITNNYVRAKMTAATPQTGSSFTLSSATAASFLDAVVDGIIKIDTNGEGAQADFVVVSADVWKKMASLVDGSQRPVFDVNGDGSNTIGAFNPQRIVGVIVGLPVIYDSGLGATSKTMYIASRDAVTSWENPGAPVSMQDTNITQLFQTFALYGYMAAAATNENGLVKPTIA